MEQEFEMQAKLARKLVSVMNAVDAVEKKGRNEKQSYNYVRATDVANEVRKVLIAHGVAFTFSVVGSERWEKPTVSGGTLFFVELIVDFTFTDQDSGASRSVRGVGWGADSLDKAPYKAMTGALKYGLRMNFLIPDENDPENEDKNASREIAQSQGVQRKGSATGVQGQGRQMAEALLSPPEADSGPLFDEDGSEVHPAPTSAPQRPQSANAVPSTVAQVMRNTSGGKPVSGPQAKRFLAIALSTRMEGKGMTQRDTWDEINAYLETLGIEKAEEMLSKDYEMAVKWAERS